VNRGPTHPPVIAHHSGLLTFITVHGGAGVRVHCGGPTQTPTNPPVTAHHSRLLTFITLHGGAGVLVHCGAGVSRSASLCIAYLMRRFGWNAARARKHCQSRRSLVNPNDGFWRSLFAFEQVLGITDRSALILPSLYSWVFLLWIEISSNCLAVGSYTDSQACTCFTDAADVSSSHHAVAAC